MKWSKKLGVGAVAALLCTMSPGFAGVQHDRVVSANPVDSVPVVADGAGVFGMATVGSTTVAAGSFTQVGPRGGPMITRNNIFAFNTTTGAISDTFQPTITQRVWDVVPAGDGESVYVGGQFNNVNGAGRTAKVARINVNTGQVVSTFKAPVFDDIVTDLELANGRLYVGGYFKNVAQQPHVGMVALDATTGALTDHMDPITFADVFRDSATPRPPTGNRGVGVERFAMTPDGSRLVAIGNFRTVSGQPRVQVAMIDTSGAQAALTSWSTTRFSMTCSASFPTYTLGIDISPDGKYFVIGTGGAFNGGVASGTLCDSNSRWEMPPPGDPSGPNQQPTWVDYIGGDTTTAVHITGAAIYLGGHFRWLNDPFAADAAGPGSVGRKGMAAVDPRNGLPLSWNAGKLPLNWGVNRFYSTAGGLFVGHDGDTLRDEPTGRFGLLPRIGGKILPDDGTGSLPGDAYLGGTQGNDNLFRTSLTETEATSTTQLLGEDGIDWRNVRGAFMADGRLYTGWSDRTLTWRTFDGTTFGTPTTINLRGLTAFGSELPDVRAMWFDRTTGRMYFTLRDQSQLFYRYFTPESTTVGAVRFTAPNTGSGIDWSRVTGGFLANGKLYYSNNSDGALRSVQWQDGGPSGGGPTGASTVVSGPTVDGRNWGSGSLFLNGQ